MCAAPYRRLSVALCVALAVVFGSLPRAEIAYAATFTVATTTDAPHTTPPDGNCTSTLAGNPCTLRAAVQAANFLGGSNQITLPAGIYALTVTGPGQDAAAGDLNITAGSLTIVGADARTTIIDGNHTDRIFFVQLGASANIANVLMRNGITTNPPSSPAGAGILNNGTITLTNVTMRDNSATTRGIEAGGAIASNGTATLDNVTLLSNVAGTGGGGINNSGTLLVTNSTISGNGAQSRG